MLVMFTAQFEWNENIQKTFKFCAVTQEEFDFVSLFLLCYGEDLRELYEGRYDELTDIPNIETIHFKLKILSAALTAFGLQRNEQLDKYEDFELIHLLVDYFKSITKWDIVDKKTGLTAFLRNYSTKNLSNKIIITEMDVNCLIQKEYPEGAYVDKDGIVQAAVERNRQYMLNKAKWKTELLKEKGLYGRK